MHVHLLGVLNMFQIEFLKNSRFWPFYSDFKIKFSENSCKNNILLSCLKWTSNTSKDAEFKATSFRSMPLRGRA